MNILSGDTEHRKGMGRQRAEADTTISDPVSQHGTSPGRLSHKLWYDEQELATRGESNQDERGATAAANPAWAPKIARGERKRRATSDAQEEDEKTEAANA